LLSLASFMLWSSMTIRVLKHKGWFGNSVQDKRRKSLALCFGYVTRTVFSVQIFLLFPSCKVHFGVLG
jgi:hypothetical protein